MGQMNMAHAGHGSSTENPFDSLGKAIAGRSNNMQHAILQSGMQGAQHAHEKEMQSATHGHEINMAVVGHVLGQDAADNAHKRNVHFFDSVNKHAEGGTSVSIGFGDTKLDYTRKAAKVRAPKAAPAKPQGPQAIGMPINIATAGKPAAPAAPEAPAEKKQKYAHRDPVTRKISGYKDYPQEPLAPKKPAKKAAVKKAAPKKKK
jgi:hypothetical protein